MDENMNNAPVQGKKNGIAIAGFVVGIVSIFWNFYCITGIVGLILSIIGMKKSKELGTGKPFAIAGICCSIVGIVVGIIAIFAIVALFSAVESEFNSLNSLYY